MDPHKRFWLWAGAKYYPGCGPGDLRGSFDSIESACAWYRDNYEEWSCDVEWGWVLDMNTRQWCALSPLGAVMEAEWADDEFRAVRLKQ